MTVEKRSENTDPLRAKQVARSALLAQAQRQPLSAKAHGLYEPLPTALSAPAFDSKDARRAYPCGHTAAASEGSSCARPESSAHPVECKPSLVQATKPAAAPWLRVGESDSPRLQHTPPQPQGSPLRDRLPSTIRIGIAAKPARGSAHRKCQSALRASPSNVIAAR